MSMISKFLCSFCLSLVYICITVKYSNVRYIQSEPIKCLDQHHSSICQCGSLIQTISCCGDCFSPQCQGTLRVLHHCMHSLGQCLIGSFSNSILLWSMQHSEFE